MYELGRPSKLVAFGLIGSLAFAAARSGSEDHERQVSKSITCTALTVEPYTPPDTFEAQISWLQRKGPAADTMQFGYYNGRATTYFPLSAVTHHVQLLHLTASQNLAVNNKSYVQAEITDTTGAVAQCPPVNIFVK